ncbi:hypothetical protein [Calothrix sp. UHCC 0171]|uniref:hypothetical protein n=1 Tax=Calothrix sp. UHCC 0171 TaxID=3110245 RepID=UPI002B1F87C5|nr:hypothetical protein [Calothrix sp. UHCC 0171]MEA5571243.1 hypothetical protein [Calothrix sp. UHCC 0171]
MTNLQLTEKSWKPDFSHHAKPQIPSPHPAFAKKRNQVFIGDASNYYRVDAKKNPVSGILKQSGFSPTKNP